MKKTLILMFAVITAMMLLASCSGKSDKVQNGCNVNVYVKDEGGNPVAKVKVQACDDSVCMTADTDANGYAGFEMSSAKVDVHILKVPEGFAADANDTFPTDANGNVTITLKSSGN